MNSPQENTETLDAFLKRFEGVSHSELSHHGESCCRQAKGWFLSKDLSLRHDAEMPPAWIRTRHEWGPSRWPLHWCDAVRTRVLDCGALAALSREAWNERDGSVLPCQLIQRFDSRTVAHRRAVWAKAGCSPDWTMDDLGYHEACAVLHAGVVRLWDPSTNTILDQSNADVYGAIVAIKIGLPAMESAMSVRWGAHLIPYGQWIMIDERISQSTASPLK